MHTLRKKLNGECVSYLCRSFLLTKGMRWGEKIKPRLPRRPLGLLHPLPILRQGYGWHSNATDGTAQ